MDGYVPPHCNVQCGCCCCVHRPTVEKGIGRSRGVYLVPMAVLIDEEDDYETEPPLYYHYHSHSHQGLQATRRRWLRSVEEEAAFQVPSAHFAYLDHRNKRGDTCKTCASDKAGKEKKKVKGHQQEFLHTLAQRLEALEVGLEDLARVRNCPAVAQKPQRRRGGRHVKRSNPAANDFSTFTAESSRGPVKKLSENKSSGRKAMDPEEAAAVIQSRFRAYLVRRSQSLRHLGDLAMMKSRLRELKYLFADERYRRLLSRDPDERKAFSEKATVLLLKVDSVQGSELMVREARRSLSKELVTLLDSLDDMVGNSKCIGGRRRPVRHTQDMMANEPLRMSTECFHSTVEMPMAPSFMSEEEEEEEEEEVIEGPVDWRGRLSHGGHFTVATLQPVHVPVPDSNRHRHSHAPQQCGRSEFNMSRYTSRKWCRNDRKKFRGKMAGMEEVTGIGPGYYSFPF